MLCDISTISLSHIYSLAHPGICQVSHNHFMVFSESLLCKMNKEVPVFRWLVSQGQTDRAITILHKFQRVNGTNVDENIFKQFKVSCYTNILSNTLVSQKFESLDQQYIKILFIILHDLIRIINWIELIHVALFFTKFWIGPYLINSISRLKQYLFVSVLFRRVQLTVKLKISAVNLLQVTLILKNECFDVILG